MCRRSLSLIWPYTKKLAQALKHKLFPEGGRGEGRYLNKWIVKSSNAQSIAWGRERRGNVGAWNCRMHYVRYLKIILKIISRNKFKKSLFIWLSTQPQIRRSFGYYFMAHLWSCNSLPVYRYLNILLLFLVLLQSYLNTCWKWWRSNKHPGLKECPPQLSASFKGSNILWVPSK